MTRERKLLLHLYQRYRWARWCYNRAVNRGFTFEACDQYYVVMLEAHNSLMAAKQIWNQYEH